MLYIYKIENVYLYTYINVEPHETRHLDNPVVLFTLLKSFLQPTVRVRSLLVTVFFLVLKKLGAAAVLTQKVKL
jgi:hypothetical protein